MHILLPVATLSVELGQPLPGSLALIAAKDLIYNNFTRALLTINGHERESFRLQINLDRRSQCTPFPEVDPILVIHISLINRKFEKDRIEKTFMPC